MAEIKKILIANRGEIAVRIARACRDAGITSVAVYSDPDRTAFHVRCADEAYPLGGTTSAETYLVQEKIINAAKECGAEAIHPGYGFLAENHKFAELCVRNDIIFIGPSPEVIRLLGDKLEARRTAKKAGLPLAPASTRDVDDIEGAREEAEKIGFILKVVDKENLLNEAIKLAEEMLTKSPLGLRMTKEALNLSLDSPSLNSIIQFENSSIVLTFSSKDADEAASAFFGKRKPKYELK